MAASNIYDIDQALANIKSPTYSSGQAAALLTALDPDGVGKGLATTGTAIEGIGTDLQTAATANAKAQLLAASQAGMQIDPLTGQPIDPTGVNVDALLEEARTATPTGLDLGGMVDLDKLTQYQGTLAKDRRDATQELRALAGEERTAELHPYIKAEKNWQNQLLEQKKALKEIEEKRTAQKFTLEQLQRKANIGKTEAGTAFTKTQRDELTKKITLLKKEIAHKDREWTLKNNNLEADLGFTRKRTAKVDAEIGSMGIKDAQEQVVTQIKKEELETKRRENRKEKRLEQDKIAMAPQFEKIITAQTADAKAGITDFSKSSEFKEYHRLFNVNRKNRRKNDALQAEFAERISNLNLPITPAQLIEAGVVLTNEAGEITGYDYSPSARKQLDRILATAYKAKFGTFGKPSSAIVDQLRKSAIAQNKELSVGFKDAADVASKEKVIRDTKDFNEALQAGIDQFRYDKPGTKLDTRVKNLRKELIKGPYVPEKAKLLNDALRPFIDRNLSETKIKLALGKFGKEDKIEPDDPIFGKIKWDKKLMAKYKLSPIDLKSKKTKYAAFTTFESDFKRAIANNNIGASEGAIADKKGLALSRIPGYVTAKLSASLKHEASKKVDAVHIETPALIAKEVQEMTVALKNKGHIAYMTSYLEKNHAKAYAGMEPEDLKQSLGQAISRAEELYGNIIRDPMSGDINMSAQAELYHAVLKMYAGSTGDSTWWWHDTIGPKGTEFNQGFLWLSDKGLNRLSDDQFRSAVDTHMPNNLIGGDVSTEARIARLKAQLARLNKQK